MIDAWQELAEATAVFERLATECLRIGHWATRFEAQRIVHDILLFRETRQQSILSVNEQRRKNDGTR